MIRTLPHDLRTISAICVLAAAITACGGGSGDGDNTDGTDDTQGLLGSTLDSDGDGLPDTLEDTIGTNPNLVDTDADGLDDGTEYDVHLTNPLEADSDGDGTNDLDEINAGTNALDANDGGTIIGVDNGTDNGNTNVDACDDADSSNDSWADNCVLKRFGTYADSSYTRGMQRILWCQNNGDEQNTDINIFADGEIGPATDASIRAYQTANPPLSVDGIVGPETWLSLRSKLELMLFSSVDGFDAHSIAGCATTDPQFYQQVSTILDSNDQLITEFLGWRLAQFPGSTTLVPFSSEL